jgi:hypothetical protein
MLGNLILETTNAPGNATDCLLLGPSPGRLPFGFWFGSGAACFYVLNDGTQQEWGIGTYTAGSPNKLSRTTVLKNSAGSTARLNFMGSTRVYNDIPAERSLWVDNSGNVYLPGIVTGTGFQVSRAGGAGVLLTDPSAPLDAKTYNILSQAGGFYLQSVNDAFTGIANFLSVARSGYTVTGITLAGTAITLNGTVGVGGNLSVTGTVGTATPSQGNAVLNSGGTSPGYVAFWNAAGARVGYAGHASGANLTLTAEGSVTGWSTNLAFTVGGNLTAGYVYSNGGFTLNNSGANIASDASFTYFFQDGGNWRWQYTRGNGTMTWCRGGDSAALFSIDPNGNTLSNGSHTAGNFMSNGGTFYVAGNTNYYMGRNPVNGTWNWVENTVTTMSLDTSGSLNVRNVFSAGTNVHAGGTLYASADNMVFGSGGTGRVMQYQPAWYWDWNIGNGELTWMGANSLWVQTRASDAYWVNYKAGMTGNGQYVNYSDERGKRDVDDAAVGLPEILRINPIRFTRLAERVPDLPASGPRMISAVHAPEIGFSAQQLQAIIPEAVRVAGIPLPDGTGGMDDAAPTLGVTIEPLVAALVNSCKELMALNTALAARVAALEARP